MNSKPIFSALVAMTLAAAGSAFADSRGDRDDRGRAQRGDQHDRRDNAGQRSDRRDFRGPRHDARRDWRGAGPNRSFHRGDRLPAAYRHRHYVVNDWRGHRLSAPPRGYHWVQTGGDYVLVAIATGVILQLMLNN